MSLLYVPCYLVLKTEYDVDRGEQVKRMVTFKVGRVSKYVCSHGLFTMRLSGYVGYAHYG